VPPRKTAQCVRGFIAAAFGIFAVTFVLGRCANARDTQVGAAVAGGEWPEGNAERVGMSLLLYRHAVLLAPRKQVMFNAAVADVGDV
jgi:hypothetical protein